MKKIIIIFLFLVTFMTFGCSPKEQTIDKTINVGDVFQLALDGEEMGWISSDESVAIISNYGIVTAVAPGRSIISYKNQKINLEVNSEEKNPILNVSGSQSLYIGESVKLTPIVENVEEEVVFTYQTYNENIATVTSDGLVTGLQNGLTTIKVTATFSDVISKEVLIYVMKQEEEKTLVNITQNINYVLSGDLSLDQLNQKVTTLVNDNKNSVVGVTNYQYENSFFKPTLEVAGVGTGFIFEKIVNGDGSYTYFCITNEHVIRDAEKVTVYFGYVDKEVDAKLLTYSEKYDLALISFKSSEEFKLLEFGETEKINDGDFVVAIGNANGYTFFGTVSFGVVSYNDRKLSGEASVFIQHDASINRGNSGGPLFDIDGKVIGVNTLKIVEESVENMGFAIRVDIIQEFIKSNKNLLEIS